MNDLSRLQHRIAEPHPAPGGVPDHEYDFHFTAGRPSLDLVATIGERWRRAFERLRTPADLGRWAVQGGFVQHPPAVRAVDLDAARQLRASIARLVFARADDEPLPPSDRDEVNLAAAFPDVPPALDPVGGLAGPGKAPIAAVLSTVARDAIDLLANGDPTRVRECAADDCSLLFYDASRPGTRRWCSMAACGNRAKTTRYRNRQAVSR